MSVAEDLTTSSTPSTEELLQRAESLLPAIAALRDEADRLRNMPAETMIALAQSGLMRVLQPKQWGGYECDPRTYFAVLSKIGEACPSTAWVYGVLCVQSLLLGRLDERIQAEVWGKDDGALICSSFAPAGSAEPVEGGFRLSGRWTFSSGSSFADWAMVGAQIAGAGPPAGPPVMNLFLIPRADYEIEDVWNTFGLRGTGSNDLVGKDIFVPADRHVRMDPGLVNLPRAASAKPPLYRFPWSYVFVSTISCFAVGAARAGLRDFVETAKTRVSAVTGKTSQDNPTASQAVGRMMIELEQAEAMYERHVERQMDYVARDAVIPLNEALLYRAQITSQLTRLTAQLDDLMWLQGSRAINLDSRLTRTWLDLSAARAHKGNDPTMFSTMLGGTALAAP
jgi:3-hydroxy-9,10-secoandrosta-1,3,5(10)-triene-9,17-dione monooxygenase